MKYSVVAVMCLAAGSASADPGHLGVVAGHDHWVAGAAVAIAVLIGLWGALKGRGAVEQEPETDDPAEV